MRFCTVPRATRSFFASEAIDARLSSRSRAMSCRSISSKGVSGQIASIVWQFDQLVSLSDQCSGFSLVLARRNTTSRSFRKREIMIDYIGMERVQELVSRLGTARFIDGLASEIEADFRRWPDFDKSARHATHSSVGVIELMPTSDGRLYSFKYVNGHPMNTAAGLLTVTAFGVLADVDTGYPLLLSELTLTTALRTAAMSALAARSLARPSN